jgi:ABC-type multidrug transport system fused ATPase/permease subunit
MNIKSTNAISLKQRFINRARVSELVAVTRFSFRLLQRREQIALAWLVFLQIALGLIDLAGVFLLGVVTTRFWSNHGTGGVGISSTLSSLLKLFHLNNLSLINLSILACVVFTLKALLSTLNSRRMYSQLASFTNGISDDLIRGYLNTPYVLLRKLNEQKFYFALTDGLNSLIIGVLGSLTLLISDSFMILLLFAALCFVNISSTLVLVFFFSALAVFLLRWIAPRIKTIGNAIGAISNRSREALLDLREMYPTIRRQEQMKYLTKRISDYRTNSSTQYSKGEWLTAIPKNILEFSAILGIFLIIIYASSSAGKAMSIALISLFFAASSRIVPALIRLQGNWLAFSRSAGYSLEGMEMYRLVKFYGNLTSGEDKDLGPVAHVEEPEVVISFKNVSFRYPDGDVDSIFKANFEIYSGEKIAIVGDSGAGKTTLANLILDLYQPVSGEVERGRNDEGNSVARYGYLPQVPHIISGTLLENVVLTDKNEEVDFVKVQKVLKDAHISDFIDALPDKIDTLLGPRGVSLSGGQRQRIALARVLYSNQSVVVLDEPTSSLDAETDEIVSDMLLNKLADKTVIIVAHRYSTIREVDRILYLHAGEIVCFDTWEVVRKTVPKFSLQASLQGFDS